MKSYLMVILFWVSSICAAQEVENARSDYKKALNCFENAEYEQSLSLLYQAEKSLQNAGFVEEAQKCKQAIAHNLIRQGKLSEAEKIAQDCHISIEKKPGKESLAYVINLDLLGEIYLNQGKNDKALNVLKQAQQIIEKHHKKNKIIKASVLNNTGLVYWNTRNIQLALEHLILSLNLRKEALGDNHPAVAASYNDLGLVYVQTEPAKALENYNAALAIYTNIYKSHHPKIAVANNNIALVYEQMGNYIDALTYFEKALEIWKNNYDDNHPNVAFAYNNLGRIYLEKNDLIECLDYHQKALKIYQSNYGNKHPEIANTYNFIGNAHSQFEEWEIALQNYQYAICANTLNFDDTDISSDPPINQFYNADILLVSLLAKAQNFEHLHYNKTLKIKNLKASLSTLELCDQLIEKIRNSRINKGDKIALGLRSSEVYEDAVRLSFALSEITFKPKKYLHKAFYFSEKNKAAVLLEAISETDAKTYANIPPVLLDEEKEIKLKIAQIEQKLASKPEEEEEKKGRDQLFEWNRKYDAFTKKLEETYPEYFNLKYNIKIPSVAELQEIMDEDTELISYMISNKDNRLYIFNLRKKGLKVFNVPKRDDFLDLILGLRNTIEYKSKRAFTKLSEEVFQQLFPNKIAKTAQNLIIIPEAQLGSIPFEALIHEIDKSGKEHYLLTRYNMTYAYSATLFKLMHDKSQPAKTGTDPAILLYAPVQFKGMHDLPATENEINAIASLFEKSTKNLKEDATENNLKSEDLKKYRYIHLATHGMVSESKPELSHLLLATTKDQEDGFLYAGEMYNLDLDADLITLSACQTGLGKITKGEGIIGLSRALLYAGAKNLVVSLWSVADNSTSELMVHFYEYILKGDAYPTALRKAKIDLFKTENYQHPYYWAPFVLIGQ